MIALTRPAVSLRWRLIDAGIEILPSQVVPTGKLMWWRGRKSMGVGDLEALKRDPRFPSGADTVCLSPTDYRELTEDRT